MTSTLIQVDARGRAALGPDTIHRQYLMHEESGGVLVLEPAVVMTAFEQAVLANKPLVDALDKAIAEGPVEMGDDLRKALGL